MTDREKVINELVSHIENALSVDSDYVDCIPTDLLQYAVALLKAQEPRVMTLKEVMDALDTVVWFDEPGDDNTSESYALITGYSYKNCYVNFQYISGKHSEESTQYYGVHWRCWTARPTDEQRETVKWEKG